MAQRYIACIDRVSITLRRLGAGEPHVPLSHRLHFRFRSRIFPLTHGPAEFLTLRPFATWFGLLVLLRYLNDFLSCLLHSKFSSLSIVFIVDCFQLLMLAFFFENDMY